MIATVPTTQQEGQDHRNEKSSHEVQDTGGLLRCVACGELIRERFYLEALERPWHTGCLRCSRCATPLDSHASCYARDDTIYCRDDYLRTFLRCCACAVALEPHDLVMRVRDLLFHVACFRCWACQSPLQKGDVFGLRDSRVFCRVHFQTPEKNCKRMRTSFKHNQLRAMRAYFTMNHNPDSKDLKQLSARTGLSKRVLQVWFQNARAKWRRNLLRQPSTGPEVAEDSSPLQDLGASIILEEQTIHTYANLL
ncbi:LIM/homeobox protein Lhx9-like [Ornithodoros turicata]|uniref:LIM/homeobox protein Lhx9-like n=1 Tax=Ornithodoros turicata TaxID=34597 RepID=UPI0031387346